MRDGRRSQLGKPDSSSYKPTIRLSTADDSGSYSGRRRARESVGYGQLMSRIRYVAREYWFELLIGALAVAAIVDLVLGRNMPGAPSHEPVVRRTGSGRADSSALRPPAVSVRRSGRVLGARGGALLRRRCADPVYGEPVPGRVGLCFPAREPARQQAGGHRVGDRARKHYDGRLQHPRPRDGGDHPDSRRLRNRLGRGLRSPHARRTGRGSRNTCGPGRARA